ncbi:ROK family transcriptional regulator [Streptomyces tsukubensis]|uniref:ROK family transcriptional regulator n=1 Tax=Streptomyces tsukubensis TaxID=83656 RepID=A0A1V4AES3_9ACTN|nr:ROK family transcriptional regulator [Streptomyces tsukubensis]OON82044.1 ROK family transcriptional regulator [Streptomyces tsukubensis]QFR92531.1 ROK family protein [Streptomyces tsukubensis]
MPASPSTARAINDRHALNLLQERGPLTAGQLKQLTGLSRPSVADLVERLGDSGLIGVVGESGEQRRGPNARLYGIVADRAHLAALDIRTHGVSVVVTDLVGTTLAEASAPIPEGARSGPSVERAVALLEEATREAGASALHSVGVGAPGLIDPVTGVLNGSTGLPAWHRDLVGVLRERLPATVLVENETNLAALAEQRVGAARDRDTFVLLWLGLSVGAAVVLDGSLRRGASGGTGEIGFLPVPGTKGLPSATECGGGFHALVGSAAVTALAAEHGLSARAAAHEPAAAAHIRAAARALAPEGGAGSARGQAAARFLDALAGRLAIGAASVAAVLDPGCVVLGGELGEAGGAALADRVAARLAALSPLATEVRAGSLGGGAVLRGALLMTRDAAQDEVFAARGRLG